MSRPGSGDPREIWRRPSNRWEAAGPEQSALCLPSTKSPLPRNQRWDKWPRRPGARQARRSSRGRLTAAWIFAWRHVLPAASGVFLDLWTWMTPFNFQTGLIQTIEQLERPVVAIRTLVIHNTCLLKNCEQSPRLILAPAHAALLEFLATAARTGIVSAHLLL